MGAGSGSAGRSPSQAGEGTSEAFDPYAHASLNYNELARPIRSELRAQATACLSGQGGSGRLRVLVRLAPDGRLIGRARVAGGQPSPAQARVLAAIEACAPYRLVAPRAGPVEVELELG